MTKENRNKNGVGSLSSSYVDSSQGSNNSNNNSSNSKHDHITTTTTTAAQPLPQNAHQKVTPSKEEQDTTLGASKRTTITAATATTTATTTAATTASCWPKHSATVLPDLSHKLQQGLLRQQQLQQQLPPTATTAMEPAPSLQFPINEEVTSIKFTPTGRFLLAGFADGTLRIFDLTGQYHHDHPHSTTTTTIHTTTSTTQKLSGSLLHHPPPKRSRGLVSSKQFQQFGAVACQIQAKGVHTSLQMEVDISPDGLWAFAGVVRGSMELVAVHLGSLEHSIGQADRESASVSVSSAVETSPAGGGTDPTNHHNLLDHITVYRHSDAKLRGFGACTRLQNNDNHHHPPRYLLLTGKGIKNIHIWSFTPPPPPATTTTTTPSHNHPSGSRRPTPPPPPPPLWIKLYDAQTNGNTIRFLRFRHDAHGRLQAISKSDGQKLRVWDLHEEEEKSKDTHQQSNYHHHHHDKAAASSSARHKKRRPAFQDVPNTESALGIAGSLCLCGGSEMYNQLSIVSLEGENLQNSLYNHTELALPASTDAALPSHTPSLSSMLSHSSGNSSSNNNNNNNNNNSLGNRSRRPQRGDLKCIEAATTMTTDGGHALLELSDGSIIQYTQNEVGLPLLCTKVGPPQLFAENKAGWHTLPEGWSRTVGIGRIASCGLAVAALSTYHATSGRGNIHLWSLDDLATLLKSPSKQGFWGFLGNTTLPKVSDSPDTMSAPNTCTANKDRSVHSCQSSGDDSISKHIVSLQTKWTPEDRTPLVRTEPVTAGPSDTMNPGTISCLAKARADPMHILNVAHDRTTSPVAVPSNRASFMESLSLAAGDSNQPSPNDAAVTLTSKADDNNQETMSTVEPKVQRPSDSNKEPHHPSKTVTSNVEAYNLASDLQQVHNACTAPTNASKPKKGWKNQLTGKVSKPVDAPLAAQPIQGLKKQSVGKLSNAVDAPLAAKHLQSGLKNQSAGKVSQAIEVNKTKRHTKSPEGGTVSKDVTKISVIVPNHSPGTGEPRQSVAALLLQLSQSLPKTSASADERSTERATQVAETSVIASSASEADTPDVRFRRPMLPGKSAVVTEPIPKKPRLSIQTTQPGLGKSKQSLAALETREKAKLVSSEKQGESVNSRVTLAGAAVKPVNKQQIASGGAAILEDVTKKSPPVPRKRVFAETTDKAVTACPAKPLSPSPPVPKRAPPVLATVAKPAKRAPCQPSRKLDDDILAKQIISECTKQQEKLSAQLVTLFPKTTMGARLQLRLRAKDDSLTAAQHRACARQKLSARHRAAQENMVKVVLRAAWGVLESVKQSPTLSALDEARDFWLQSLEEFKANLVSTTRTVRCMPWFEHWHGDSQRRFSLVGISLMFTCFSFFWCVCTSFWTGSVEQYANGSESGSLYVGRTTNLCQIVGRPILHRGGGGCTMRASRVCLCQRSGSGR